ncbi:unnamed protein product [Heterobilharzia americana]|nr:unnamed protein product [Heterobilharzia americana]
MTEVDIKVIRRTQESLGKIIKRPVLTDKLLGRPPFRFLHDICTAIIRATGVMKGLYTQEELNADNVKDKDKKLAFLQKLVDFLAVVHGRPIPIRIMSIVAGKEAEKTNEMLYLLAEAVNKGVNNEECVARVLHGMHKNETKTKQVEKRQESETRRPKEKADSGQNVFDNRRRQAKKNRKEENQDDEKPDKLANGPSTDGDKNIGSNRMSSNELVNMEKYDNGRETVLSQDANSRVGSLCDSRTLDRLQEDSSMAVLSNSEIPSQQTRNHRPASAKGYRIKKDAVPEASIPVTQAENKPEPVPNPRLAPPRPRRSSDLVIVDNQKPTGITGCRVSGLILSDTQQDTDEDDDNEDARFVIEETIGGESGELSTNHQNKTESEEGQEHGGLVTKILQTKKEYEDGNLLSKEKSKLQTSGPNELAREREKALMEKEINRLCNSLQTLSRSAIPLSKLMDFVQEDLETMQQEFERWKNENHSIKSQLKQEETLTQSCIEPLKPN